MTDGTLEQDGLTARRVPSVAGWAWIDVTGGPPVVLTRAPEGPLLAEPEAAMRAVLEPVVQEAWEALLRLSPQVSVFPHEGAIRFHDGAASPADAVLRAAMTLVSCLARALEDARRVGEILEGPYRGIAGVDPAKTRALAVADEASGRQALVARERRWKSAQVAVLGTLAGAAAVGVWGVVKLLIDLLGS